MKVKSVSVYFYDNGKVDVTVSGKTGPLEIKAELRERDAFTAINAIRIAAEAILNDQLTVAGTITLPVADPMKEAA